MYKQKTLVYLCILLCFLNAVDIITYSKVLSTNRQMSANMLTLEKMQTDMHTYKLTMQKQYDMLYNDVQSLHTEIANMNIVVVETVSTQEEISNRWNVTLTEDEFDLLARIVMLEAGGEPALGQEAVVEVIFNRIYHEDFPNTLEEVLSEPRQFATWKNRNILAAIPTEKVCNSINNVLNGKTHILPYETVYFGLSAENNKKQTVIGNHVFCNQY